MSIGTINKIEMLVNLRLIIKNLSHLSTVGEEGRISKKKVLLKMFSTDIFIKNVSNLAIKSSD